MSHQVVSQLPPEIIRYIASYTNLLTNSEVRRTCSTLWQTVTTNDLFMLKLKELKWYPDAISRAVRSSWPGLRNVELEVEGRHNFLRVHIRSPLETHHTDTHRDWLHAAVQHLFDAGFNINADDGGAIRAAAARGDETLVRMLIDMGADVNLCTPACQNLTSVSKFSWEYNALQQAAANGYVSVLMLLLEAGSDIHAFNNMALRVASSRGFLDVVHELVLAGADVSQGETIPFIGFWKQQDRPLQLAAANGHLRIVRQLIMSGADVNQGDEDERPLQLAASAGHTRVVRELLSAGAEMNVAPRTAPEDPDEDVAQEWNALTRAARFGHIRVVQTLLDAGADVHAGGNAALLIAAGHGRTDVVIDLISRGAAVNPRSRRGGNPLCEAAAGGHVHVVQVLLRAGAKPTSQRNAALCAAAMGGHVEVVDELVKAKAVPSARGSAALLQAVENRHTTVVRRLLELGANSNHRNGRIIQAASSSQDPHLITEFLPQLLSITSPASKPLLQPIRESESGAWSAVP
ncbi:ankyrin repeat-containing domain protein [Powellomyces hirtus]|nr:ankyrin repeat-containing domain protein [Powellomyces hirtus]